MNFINDLKIKTKLFLLAGIVCVGLAYMSVLTLTTLDRIKSADAEVTAKWMPAVITAEELNGLTFRYRILEYRHVLSENPNVMVDMEKQMRVIEKRIDEGFSVYEGLPDGQAMERAQASWNAYQIFHEKMLASSRAFHTVEARGLLEGESKVLFDEAKMAFSDTVQFNKAGADAATRYIDTLYQELLCTGIISTALILCLTLWLLFFIVRSITRPVAAMRQAVECVEEGNLNASCLVVGGFKDEISVLADALRLWLERIQAIISDQKRMFNEIAGENFAVKSQNPKLYVGDFEPLLVSVYDLRNRLEHAKKREYQLFLFQVLAERIDTVFMIYDLTQRKMEYVFSNAERILGISAEKIALDPSKLCDSCKIEQAEKIKILFQREAFCESVKEEVEMCNPITGELRWMEFSVSPVLLDGCVSKYVIGVKDLTETRQTQQVLKESLLSAQNANRAKSNFFSCMSHEIRTPLNAIIGMTAIAAATQDKARLQDCLGKIAFSSKHLFLLINDILDMSKIESGKLSIAHAPFSMEELLNSITSVIYPQAKAREVSFALKVEGDFHDRLQGDALRVSQILLNILSNAVKFTPSGGSIKVLLKERMRSQSGMAYFRFKIIDTGRGMSKEFLGKLFQPFEQEGPAHGVSQGTGLGMPITKNLIDMMNGSIRVESEIDKGTVFTVDIPFDIEEDASPVSKNEVQEDMRALVVDDDRTTCEHTALLLDKIGIRAEWVTSGPEAVEKVERAHEEGVDYDVAMIDWQMPVIDGIETARRIRKVVGPDTTIIIISGYDWQEIEQEARLAGVDAFISKPIFQSSLYNTIISATRHIPKPAPQEDIASEEFKGERFLVVEDNAINMEITTELLWMTGAQTECAKDGVEAVDMFMAAPQGYYGAILMDIQMPRLNGYDATRRIRGSDHPDARHIPIIAMTANAFAEEAAMSLEVGMNAHVTKPVDVEMLYRTLRQEIVRSHEKV